jgi:hypothetical protein
MANFMPAVYFILILLGTGFVIAGIAIIMSRKYGGSTIGGIKRSFKFILFLFLCAQYIVQVGKATKTARGIPGIFRKMLIWLEALQFSGLSLPAECLTSTPFASERAQMIVALVSLGLLYGAMFLWPIARQIKRRFSAAEAPVNELVQAARDKKPPNSLLAAVKSPYVYRRLFGVILSIIFALVCNTCLGLIKCDDPRMMRVSAYLTRINDRSALKRAGIQCSALDPFCRETLPVDVAKRLLLVSLSSKYPDYVCEEGAYSSAQALAKITILCLAGVYPIFCFFFLWLRLRWRYQRFLHSSTLVVSKSSGYERLMRVPCSQLHRTCCCERISYCTRSAQRKMMKDETIKLPPRGVCDKLTCSRRPLQTNDSNTASDARILERMDLDLYFSPLVGKEFLPSSYYFVQLNQVVTVVLSLSLVYLDNPSQAWARVILTSFIILGMVGLIVSTKPYRSEEEFGSDIQIAALCISFLVTLTGFFASLTDSTTPGTGLVSNILPVDSRNMTGNVTLSAIVEIPSEPNKWVPVTSAFSYLTLIAMLILGLWLLVSFFIALKAGAEREEEKSIPEELRSIETRDTEKSNPNAFVFNNTINPIAGPRPPGDAWAPETVAAARQLLSSMRKPTANPDINPGNTGKRNRFSLPKKAGIDMYSRVGANAKSFAGAASLSRRILDKEDAQGNKFGPTKVTSRKQMLRSSSGEDLTQSPSLPKSSSDRRSRLSLIRFGSMST